MPEEIALSTFNSEKSEQDIDEGMEEEQNLLGLSTPSTKFTYRRNWAAFFILGTINNLTYVVVGSAAKTIAHNFHKDNLIGLITWANVGFGIAARTINAFFMKNVSYSTRYFANAVLLLAGLVGLALAPSFWVALLAIVISGAGSSFGESVALGYIRLYPSTLVNAWSSGTGMAGVGGSALYVAYQAGHLSLPTSFLVTMPWVGIYLFAYFFLLDRKGPEAKLKEIDASPSINPDEVEEPKEKFGKRLARCCHLIAIPSLNLILVYIFEYVISAGFASKVLTPEDDCNFDHKAACLAHSNSSHCYWDSNGSGTCESHIFVRRNAYAILAFCYQVGVLLSRSSLQVFKINRVEILTILQGINFVLWLLQDMYKFINIWVLFPLMLYVGLLGGASYVNIFYQLLHDKKIPNSDREYCINLAAFGITLGITFAACLILVFDLTFLSND
eukprot:m.150083 g.150083  ORF g.150083 m.150083 type:complete len:445 (-) comp24453_c0_seq2:31-1365(-)